MAEKHGVTVHSAVSHTLHDVEEYLGRNKGEAPKTYQAFCALIAKLPPIPEPIPSATFDASQRPAVGDDEYRVPTLEELGYSAPGTASPFRGGETHGLLRLQNYFHDIKRTAAFEKPATNPCAFDPPSTTVLSPYLKFGCVSARRFYHELMVRKARRRPSRRARAGSTRGAYGYTVYYMHGTLSTTRWAVH